MNGQGKCILFCCKKERNHAVCRKIDVTGANHTNKISRVQRDKYHIFSYLETKNDLYVGMLKKGMRDGEKWDREGRQERVVRVNTIKSQYVHVQKCHSEAQEFVALIFINNYNNNEIFIYKPSRSNPAR